MRPPHNRLVFALALAIVGNTPGFAGGQNAAQPLRTGKPLPAKALFQVTEFGAVGDGETKATQAIQHAINAANEAGGGIVYFPPGVYLSGSLRLQSNVTLFLETGDFIQNPSNLQIRPQNDGINMQGLCQFENRLLLRA